MKKKTEAPIVSLLADAFHRQRFVEVHDKNISVIAPAGVGKTRSLVDRIVQLAGQPHAEDLLPRLVVVTFSVAAAQEMQSRARVALRGARLKLGVQRAFQQTFFGTIHSFCVRLLSRFGHYLGLPGALTLPRSEEELWERFLIHGARRDPAAEPELHDLFHFFTVEELYGLGRTVSPGPEGRLEAMALPEAQRLLNFATAGLHPSTRKAVGVRQEALVRWADSWAKGERFQPLPTCCENPPEFVELWRETFAPLNDWLRRGALEFGRRVANDFAAFRLHEGVMTYDDQVRLALEALRTDPVREELRRERWSVLLDEAQDTDGSQFEVLARVAGLVPETPGQAPGQTFCIVGDFQQAIWAPRSDLKAYQEIHVNMVREPAGLAVELTVTFRCDRAIIDFVNRIFDPLLDHAEGQAKFVPLQPRDAAGEGQVVRWTCPVPPADDEKLTTEKRARHEAQFVAGEMKRIGCAGLGAENWKDVAILCPRRDWLHVMDGALRAAGIETQLHSGDESQAGSTPRAWLTALVWIAAHPEDRFEIAGVLRDIFGVADEAMALFTGGDGDLLRLDLPARHDRREDEVAEALAILRRAGEGIAALPLHQAARQLMDRTRLRDRVVSLGEETPPLIDREFGELLAQVDERAAQGATLSELARELRDSLGEISPAGEEIRDGAVQLYTWHKSKGLEWQTVIVPFIFRSFGDKPTSYPRVILRAGQEIVYRDSADYEAGAKALVEERARQQFQRLLYVACTRPKHTLLLIDDEVVFEDAKPVFSYGAAKLLRIDEEPARAVWRALPAEIHPRPPAARATAAAPELIPPYPALEPEDVAAALVRARDIPERITPHALAHRPPPEAEPEAAAERDEPSPDSPAILYGTWWHETMETLPWTRPREAWDAHLGEAIRNSPQPERARREWEILRGSEFARWLAEPGRIIHRELPFLWPVDTRCIEGVIDLAVFSPAEGRWRVVDWKTNRTDAASLLAIYRGQVQAYVDAVRALLDAPVEGGLYLTATGELTLLEASVTPAPTTS
jgi:ATP-dependent exoDNAse (exonuclease V) beta subunit